MRSIAIILALALAACLRPLPADHITCTVVRVIDGDSIRVRIDDVGPEVLAVQTIRLLGCDCPELHDRRPEIRARAEAARDLVARLLPPGTRLTVESVRPDKYGGRLLGTIRVGGRDLCQCLEDATLAHAYAGGPRGW